MMSVSSTARTGLVSIVVYLSFMAALTPSLTAQTIVTIPIKGDITQFRAIAVRRAITEARQQQADLIIFAIDTFGGRVDSTLQITSAITSLDTIPSAAYITADIEDSGVSWSAGAIITFACDHIFMAPSTSIGAAAPVYNEGGEMTSADEKVVSALRSKMAALAEENGHNTAVAMAMVDQDVELYEVNGTVVSGDDSRSGDDNARLINGRGKLLSLTAGQMQRYSIASIVSNREEIAQTLLSLEEEPRWIEINDDVFAYILAWLSGSIVISLLTAFGVFALLIELSQPGFGLPGTLAISAFTLIFGISALQGLLSPLEVLLFVGGLLLLIFELLIIPGFGICGITGIIFIIISLTFSRLDFSTPQNGADWQQLFIHTAQVMGSLLVAFFAFIGLILLIPRLKINSPLILNTVSPDTTVGPDNSMVGDTGAAYTDLRPSGRVNINGMRYSAQTEGDFIDRGSEIEVLRQEGFKIIVRRIR